MITESHYSVLFYFKLKFMIFLSLPNPLPPPYPLRTSYQYTRSVSNHCVVADSGPRSVDN